MPALWLALVLLAAQWQVQIHGYGHGHLGLAQHAPATLDGANQGIPAQADRLGEDVAPALGAPAGDLADCSLCLACAATAGAPHAGAAPALTDPARHAAPTLEPGTGWQPAFTPVYASRAPPLA
ncbi:MAG: hypothetical protein RL375_2376 [Pseudomonadota bacterium]